MREETRNNWPIILFFLAIASFLIFIISMFFSEREEDYEYLLERRDMLYEKLLKLKSKRLEGEISEDEYEKLVKSYSRELQNIDKKLEKMEKRPRVHFE